MPERAAYCHQFLVLHARICLLAHSRQHSICSRVSQVSINRSSHSFIHLILSHRTLSHLQSYSFIQSVFVALGVCLIWFQQR